MKKVKVQLINPNNVWDDNLIKIGDVEGEYYFEIMGETTKDISEAIALLLRLKRNYNQEIWNLEVPKINLYNIEPYKCLYWMSGGDLEWINGHNYKKLWSECYLSFQEEFGETIINIIEKSKTLNDIKEGLLSKVNLPILYEFSLKKGFV